MSGIGNIGPRVINTGGGYKAGEEIGFLGALGLDRKLKSNLSIGAQIQTNKSALLGVGLDF
jgi:hypothetical protein